MGLIEEQLVHCGGWTGTVTLQSCRGYRRGESSWTLLPSSLPKALFNHASTSINRGLIILGGYCGSVCPPYGPNGFGGTTDQVLLIEPSQSGFTAVTSLTSKRTGACAVPDIERNRIIITGGNPNMWKIYDPISTVESISLDDLSGPWSSLPDLITPVAYHACGISSINGHQHLVVIRNQTTEVLQLDDPSATWTQLSTLTHFKHRISPTTATINGKLHLVGGLRDDDFADAENR